MPETPPPAPSEHQQIMTKLDLIISKVAAEPDRYLTVTAKLNELLADAAAIEQRLKDVKAMLFNMESTVQNAEIKAGP